jgi:hypothetical protein
MEKSFPTIVGGRSAAYEGLKMYPRGIEVLQKKAKVDEKFRRFVLKDPLLAAASIELTLQENEKKILASTPKSVLRNMIQNTFVPKQQIRTFLTQKAPVMLTLLLASTVILPAGAGSEGVTADDMVQYEFEEATDKMAVLQSALQQYKLEHGRYPSTEQWLAETNPLASYVGTNNLFDPWKRKFHYQAVRNQAGEVVNYFLESLGLDPEDSGDNIPCPIESEMHRFPETH